MNASTRGSRREIALVAGALLLPIPVLAGSGLTFPLPDAVERGIASLSQSAGGGGPLAAGDSISVGAPDEVASATRAFVFDEPVARFGDTGTAIPDPSASRGERRSRWREQRSCRRTRRREDTDDGRESDGRRRADDRRFSSG